MQMADEESTGSVGFGIIATIASLAVMGYFPLIGWIIPGIFGSGNFGTVFKVKTDGGIYAIKCFTRGSPDLEIRYMAISSFILEKSIL